jgi:hypothetical protein
MMLRYILLLICLIAVCVAEPAFDIAGQAGKTGKVQPDVKINNFDYQAGIGVPIYKSNNFDLGVGARVNGNMRYRSPRNYGAGFTAIYRF